MFIKFIRRRRLERSNYGRDFGWIIKYENEEIGELVDGKLIDHFWFEYKVVPYEGFEGVLSKSENWNRSKFKYLNKKYLLYAESAFSGSLFKSDDDNIRITMRGLHLDFE